MLHELILVGNLNCRQTADPDCRAKLMKMSKWPTHVAKPARCALSFTLTHSTPVLSSCLLTSTLRQTIERIRNRLIVLLLCCAWWEERMCARRLWMWALVICESTLQTARGGRYWWTVRFWGLFLNKKKKEEKRWHFMIMARFLWTL